MNGAKAVLLNIVFGIIMEYLIVPIALVYVPYYFFFPTAPMLTVFAVAVWGRVAVELFVRVVSGAWYGEKYNRQK